MSASIRPHTLDDVVEALREVGLHEVVVTEAHGFTRRPRISLYRGVPYPVLDERVVVDVIVRSGIAGLVGDLIAANAVTGRGGDGHVWASPLDFSIDISSGRCDI